MKPRGPYSTELTFLGFALILLAAVIGGAAVRYGPGGVEEAYQQAKDQVTSDPDYPPYLVDHKEKDCTSLSAQELAILESDCATLLRRGAESGATPSKSYPRPDTYFADLGVKYTFEQSPNWSSRGFNVIEAIVIHVTGPGTCPGMTSWFKNPSAGASAHFGVCKDGSIIQYVELGDGAWHAGIYNRPDLTNALINSWYGGRANPNSVTVGIEYLLAPGEQLYDYPAMQKSGRFLLSWLTTTFQVPPDRTHWIGHYQIDSVNRSVDPRCCLDIDTELQQFGGLTCLGEPVGWGGQWDSCRQIWVGPGAWDFNPSLIGPFGVGNWQDKNGVSEWDEPVPVSGGFVVFNRRVGDNGTWYQYGETIWQHQGGDNWDCLQFCFEEAS